MGVRLVFCYAALLPLISCLDVPAGVGRVSALVRLSDRFSRLAP